jgi:hypothetical protein
MGMIISVGVPFLLARVDSPLGPPAMNLFNVITSFLMVITPHTDTFRGMLKQQELKLTPLLPPYHFKIWPCGWKLFFNRNGEVAVKHTQRCSKLDRTPPHVARKERFIERKHEEGAGELRAGSHLFLAHGTGPLRETTYRVALLKRLSRYSPGAKSTDAVACKALRS